MKFRSLNICVDYFFNSKMRRREKVSRVQWYRGFLPGWLNCFNFVEAFLAGCAFAAEGGPFESSTCNTRPEFSISLRARKVVPKEKCKFGVILKNVIKRSPSVRYDDLAGQ